MPGLHSQKGHVSMQINIDPAFTGILRGLDNGVADPTFLKGTLVVTVYKPVKVRKMTVRFEGRCKVTINTSSGSVLVAAPEGVECRNLVTKKSRLLTTTDEPRVLPPGKHTYAFEFELPPQLPASFNGKRGLIRYRLRASIHRSVFANNLFVYREIPIRRSLVYDAIPLDLTETIVGRDYPEKIHYSASAPSVVYREGGLVPLNLTVQMIQQDEKHPDNSNTIRAITCALRERIIYQTTGQQSLTCQSVSQTDELFPLGWSTFYPSEQDDANYNPYAKHQYNAEFRLCPRVHPDIKTRLIKVSHALIVNIKMTVRSSSNSNDGTSVKVEYPYQQQQQQQQQKDSSSLLPSIKATNNNNSTEQVQQEQPQQQQQQQQQESTSSRGNTPPLSRSSSSSSLSSIFSLGRQQASNTEEYVKDALMTLSSKRHSHNQNNESSQNVYVCSLEVPVVITSRQHCWEGEMPQPPAYQNAEHPPTYRQSIEHLPPAPVYRNRSSS
ncbi:hypothetical protein BDB00DRAFT_918788 [Zychaea mexicana]|uniref:uncharacterized protein n=1 Tax=Zychaea mexicana TaxID=64656 RepID=UPI0022FF29BB|nr:uncharacterized protein BDB00DRAFT_918788 [Zychaea mexicana]KAI9497604.1 hypothetical protein BDB00DRAFT_918788 [Zychaea mexicana]